MNENSSKPYDLTSACSDPVFMEIFIPLYENYKMLDRDFDKKVIDRDLENLRRKFETISKAKERRKIKL